LTDTYASINYLSSVILKGTTQELGFPESSPIKFSQMAMDFSPFTQIFAYPLTPNILLPDLTMSKQRRNRNCLTFARSRVFFFSFFFMVSVLIICLVCGVVFTVLFVFVLCLVRQWYSWSWPHGSCIYN
jgi:hypothetical protein